LIALIKDILDDEHGKDFVEIAVSLYAAQHFPRGAIMSEDNIANFVDRLIAKRQKEKETDNDSEFQDEVESLGALIEDELRDLSVDQRIALASVLANALAGAVIQMHRQHGANREDIVRALAAAAKALSTPNEFRLS
jgi:glycine/D-amino acid oxidase-like deaminating enzyme